MMSRQPRTLWATLRTLVLVLSIAGCATTSPPPVVDGRNLIESGHVEDGLASLQAQMVREPDNRELRAYYFNARSVAVQRYLSLAENARSQAMYDEAEQTYRHVLALDRENSRARAGLETLQTDRRHRGMVLEAENLFRIGNAEAAWTRAREVLAENSSNRDAIALLRRLDAANARPAASTLVPARLGEALRKPVTLEFRDASLRAVFELLSKNTGLNFIFDRDVPPDLKTTVFVRDTTVEEVIRFVLVTSQLESKILNDNTILVYPNTPAKAQTYKELLVRNFYLENADVKRTADMIKALVKTRDLFVDEKLNLIVMRDTAEAIRMAERLVASQDLAEPEVMLEVEVLEVSGTVQNQIGIQWPSQIGIGVVGAAGTPGTITLPEWLNRNAGLVRLTVSDPLFLLSLRKQDGSTNLLANPRIRVKNREKARVHIGDKVPVITTTTTATGFVAESVNYLDVGLKLEVEPNVFLENDVGIRVGLEVSNITSTVRSPAGTLTYQVGTRNANTVLRLRDGETQVLAGLINDEDRRNATRVPGLGDAPVVGRLFSSTNNTRNKTEIMLLITPRVVRNITRPGLMEEYLSGTDAAIGSSPLALGSARTAAAGAVSSTARFSLRAPARARAGEELSVSLDIDSEAPLRSGALSLAYDPQRLRFMRAEAGPMLTGGQPAPAFNVHAPEQAGRLSLSFSGSSDIKGKGEAATLVFQALAAGATPAAAPGVAKAPAAQGRPAPSAATKPPPGAVRGQGGAAAPVEIRIDPEALSIIDANARVLPAPLPTPVVIQLTP